MVEHVRPLAEVALLVYRRDLSALRRLEDGALHGLARIPVPNLREVYHSDLMRGYRTPRKNIDAESLNLQTRN